VQVRFEPAEPGSERRVFAGMRLEPVVPYTWF